MDPASSDRIFLVTGPGPEALAALLVLVVAAAGAFTGVVMARRGRIEAWSLVGAFGLVMLGAAVVLAYVPTRLVLDARGVELGFWTYRDHRPWSDVARASLREGTLGTWVTFSAPADGGPLRSLLWARTPGLLVPQTTSDVRQIAMRIEAWRLGAKP